MGIPGYPKNGWVITYNGKSNKKMDDLEVSRIPILGNLPKYESKVLSGVSRDEIIQSGTRYNKPRDR